MKQIHKNHGFTLVELMVTIAIAAILVTMAIPSFTRQLQTWDVNSCAESVMSELMNAKIDSTGNTIGIDVTVDTETLGCAAHVQVTESSSLNPLPDPLNLVFINRQLFVKSTENPMPNLSYTFYSDKIEGGIDSSVVRSVVVSFNQEPRLWKKKVSL